MRTRGDGFKPGGTATLVGSLPHRDPEAACRLVLESLPGCPAWPQLPRRSFRENMTVQFSTGMPGLVLDEASEKMFFKINDGFLTSLEEFYGRIISDEVEAFAIPPENARGLEAFVRLLPDFGPRACLKGCVVGPVTFGMTVTDQERRPAFYRSEVADAITKTLAMKARWQVRLLKPFCRRVVIFIDEPYLAAVGSAVVNLKEEDVAEAINEVARAVRREGGLAGIHCCANTDWSLPLKTEVDIVNFDAHGFGENLMLYRPGLKKFVEEGGVLAWGIVPSSEDVRTGGAETFRARLLDYWSRLENAGLGREAIRDASMITPSCGLGTLSIDLCREIIGTLREVSKGVSE